MKVKNIKLSTSYNYLDESCTTFKLSFYFFSLTVKSQNLLVKGLKLCNSYEDFELKKLLFNVIVILCKDLPTVQVKSNQGRKINKNCLTL